MYINLFYFISIKYNVIKNYIFIYFLEYLIHFYIIRNNVLKKLYLPIYYILFLFIKKYICHVPMWCCFTNKY